MAWRSKMMPLAEWAPFQAKFEQVFLAMTGDPEMALFIQGPPSDELSTLYITDRHAEIVERFSPGGWEDSDKPTGQHIGLLVGIGDAANKFGVELGIA